jgi:hypothetical protein
MTTIEPKFINATTVADEAAEKKVLFGWCMDGNDEECIKECPKHRCSCECHALIQDVVED